MTAVPGRIEYVATVQDAHGDVGVVKFPAHVADMSADTTTLAVVYTNTQILMSALAACMNGKIVETGVTFHWNKAQKPNGPLSTYAHVFQRAKLNFGDGGLERTSISIPTPLTTDFLADGITVNPADGNISAFITAVEAHTGASSGTSFNEYLGGRFEEGKPRRRANLYNATA